MASLDSIRFEGNHSTARGGATSPDFCSATAWRETGGIRAFASQGGQHGIGL